MRFAHDDDDDDGDDDDVGRWRYLMGCFDAIGFQFNAGA